jgi:transcriptional regulator with XRE-family HTH domain
MATAFLEDGDILRGIRETSFNDLIEEVYLTSEKKTEIDYWTPLSRLIIEATELREYLGVSQASLAEKMKTRQSVISRFENLGRVPSYDFIARMAISLGHQPGMTLYGDYMTTVPLKQQDQVKENATKAGISTQTYLSRLLENAIILDSQPVFGVNALRVDAANTSMTEYARNYLEATNSLPVTVKCVPQTEKHDGHLNNMNVQRAKTSPGYNLAA